MMICKEMRMTIPPWTKLQLQMPKNKNEQKMLPYKLRDKDFPWFTNKTRQTKMNSLYVS